jgi:flagellar motor switch protein FliG
MASGGAEYARQVLSLALGADKASTVINRVAAAQPFEFLRRVDPKQIAIVLETEHPQTVALILSHLAPNQTASVFPSLSEDLQVEVARRIATMDRTPPEVVLRVAEVLQRRLSAATPAGTVKVGGYEHLAAVLTTLDKGTERRILERLTEADPAVADQVRMMMFTFDDMILLDDRSMQRVLRDVDQRDLAIALKAARDDVKEHFFRNMSSRASEMLREEIQFSGPVKIKNVEEAQQRVIAVVRRLEEAEEIFIARGEESFA